ncbi:MAG: YdeI/OmpD-associated family protein [Nakamurella sp.]
MPATRSEQPELLLPDQGAWREWLLAHHTEQLGVWLRLAKKGTAEPTSLTYAQALEEALCFGWIDGQSRSCDAATMFQRFTPRRSRSMWSQRNVGYVARLAEAGRMHPAGVAEVERARADGRWDAAYRQATDEVPADLLAAIRAEPAAAAMFEILTRQNRFAMSFRLNNVKRAETRERKIVQFVEMLTRGETLHPQKRQLPPS